MEKKKMTRAAAVELLKNRKVYVNGKSAEIQEKLFEFGFEWPCAGKEIINKNLPFIYTSNYDIIGGDDMINFIEDDGTEISAEEILAIEVVEELKENDVIVYGWGEGENIAEWISVVRGYKSNLRIDKVSLLLKSAYANTDELQYDVVCEVSDWIRKPTEEEKQKFIDTLKKSTDECAKIILKEVFRIDVEPSCPFKPFDRVLVRCGEGMEWGARFFDRMVDGEYGCTDSLLYKQCIKYEGNESLLGTRKSVKN